MGTLPPRVEFNPPRPALPSAMTPFQLLFDRRPRTTLDMLTPHMDDTEATGGLSHVIETRGRNMRGVAEAQRKIHKSNEVPRQRRNARISRSPPSVSVSEGDLVPARESDTSLFGQGMELKLVHTKNGQVRRRELKSCLKRPERCHQNEGEKKTIQCGICSITQTLL